MEYWTKEKILEQEMPAIEIDAYKVCERTGGYDLKIISGSPLITAPMTSQTGLFG